MSLFRPATDNDNRDRKAAHLWRQAGLDKTVQKVVSLKKGKASATAVVELLNEAGKKVGDAILAYSLAQNGGVRIQTEFTPDTTMVKSMARMGLAFEMNDIGMGMFLIWGAESMKRMPTVSSPVRLTYTIRLLNVCSIIM